MNAADRRRLTPTLGIVAAVLVLLLIALWVGLGRGSHWHDYAAAPPRLPPVGSTLPPPVVPPLEQFAAVWQHPLFSPDRKPELATAGGKGATSGDLKLTGVIMLPGLHMAILHDKTSGKDYRVREGQPSKGAPVLVELHPHSAVVDASGSHLQLQLIPGPSPDAGNTSTEADSNDTGAQPVPADSAGAPASAMVTRRTQGSGPVQKSGSGRESAEARAKALKARIEARRRQARHNNGGG